MTGNILAIIVCAIVLNVLGFIWYGPLFGATWGRIIGMPPASAMTPEENKAFRRKMGPVYALNFVLSIITVTAVAWSLGGRQNVWTGIIIPLLVWFGFIMPIVAGNALWSGKPRKMAWQMFFVSAGYNLIAFVATGIILSIW